MRARNIISISTLFLCASYAQAGDLNASSAWVDLHYYKYEEPGLMNEKSRLPGLSVGYRDEEW